MNDSDFEQQLSRLPLRTPPIEWRSDILRATRSPAPEPEWTWRDWLWPSPYAWGAMAAIWIACFAAQTKASPRTIATKPGAPPELNPTSMPLYALQFGRRFDELNIR